jgi:subtilisin-like proprotein convertase family protein
MYAIGGEVFLMDETAGQVLSPLPPEYGSALSAADAAAILQTQVAELQDFVTQTQARQLSAQSSRSRGMAMLEEDDPPVEQGYIFGTNDLWLEVLSVSLTNATADLVIHPPWNVTNGVYDLFATTNLVPAWWDCVLRCAPGQTNVTVTNLASPMAFFILGLTNDTDHGGMSDAYEGLLGLDPNNTNDDRATPLVGISTVDSVAMEQEPANTASFLVTRLGGHMTWPLTVALQLSGSASISVNYSLAPATLTASNVLVTIPAGQTDVLLTLTPIDDQAADGTKTATLTLGTDAGWEVDSARASATAWILEDYTRVYTTVADFNQGVLDGLEAVASTDNGHLQFKTNLPPQFPFINVACSDRGTVARINTTNGAVVGEYRTAPEGLPHASNPSRTTVDEFGNVWVANRDDTQTVNATNYGSITRIGLIIGGTRFEKVGTNYVASPTGHYIALSNAVYNTCIDRDGDGFICTSAGLADILPWNNQDGLDSNGGVSTAEDEAITEYTRVLSTGTRTIAVDKFNDIWVGGHDLYRTHLKVDGLLALPVPNSAFDANAGGYGGVIDGLGNLWSSGSYGEQIFRLVPPTNYPPQQDRDWEILPATSGYGIAVDPLYPRLWQTYPNNIICWNTNGVPVTNGDGSVRQFYSGDGGPKGLAVDTNGHIWVAHAEGSTTVGHVNTNGTFLGNVNLQVYGLWAEYFANTNLSGSPLLARVEMNSVDYSWTNAWPPAPVPTNRFSARWSGIVTPQTQGTNVFYVSADAGAAFRLTVNGTVIIENWTNPAPGPVELAGTNWLGTNAAYDLKLEYAHLSDGAQLKLSWSEPGVSKQVVPQAQFQSLASAGINGPTGISVDAAGKIWAGCRDSSTAVRIDPNAGPLVVADGQTNHVGLVDMVVSLGDGSATDPHQPPYNVAAGPYNYSDMTGFNWRVVNPGLKPLKGYWMVINDSGMTNEFWQQVSWNASLPDGCAIQVYIRAADDRAALARNPFRAVTNSVAFTGLNGRYLELRLAMSRDDATKQPVLNDLTLYGLSPSFNTDAWLDDASAYETQNATFSPNVSGPGPLMYQWYVQYPWMNEWEWTLVPGQTNAELVMTNVDSWLDGTLASVFVTGATGESLWLGPGELNMIPLTMRIPDSGSIGPAERYPATITVFGQPTNLASVTVTLWDLSHTHSADLEILLVSPFGTNIMLMSDVGGTNGVSNADIAFQQYWSPPSQAGPILAPGQYYVTYGPSNDGGVTQLPGAPTGPYSADLSDVQGHNPNGVWKLYIYDDYQPGGVGQITGSWTLHFTFQ